MTDGDGDDDDADHDDDGDEAGLWGGGMPVAQMLSSWFVSSK